jgi:excisionase family DNA binding protein
VSVVFDLDALVEQVAGRVAELLAARLPAAPAPTSPWLNVDEAADYLRCTRKRMYDLVSQSRVTVHRDGSRLLFRREDLDEYLFDHNQPTGANHR